MAELDVAKAVDELSEEAVLIEATDLQALANLTERFDVLGAWASDQAKRSMADAMTATSSLIESIIFEAVDDVESSLSVVRDVVQVLQDYARSDFTQEGLIFPLANGKGNVERSEESGKAESSGEKTTPHACLATEEPDAVETPLPPPFNPVAGDAELLGDFVIEAVEHLENADVSLLSIESEPGDEEAINAIFRAFHTIKGVAGFLDLQQILALSHEAENLLDKARKGEFELAGPVIDIIFEAADQLKSLVNGLGAAIASGGLLESDSEVPDLILRLKRVASGQLPSVESEITPDNSGQRLGTILVESGVASQEAVVAALDGQLQQADAQNLGELLIKSSSVSRKTVDDAVRVQEEIHGEKKIGEILVSMGATTVEEVDTALQKQREPNVAPKLGEVLVRSGTAKASDVARVIRSQRGSSGKASATTREVVKVDSERLDRLIDMIGELVIAQAMATQSSEFRSTASNESLRRLGQLDKITRQLQETGMSLRMVPLRSTFQKMTRLVRDLGKKSGKRVECIVTGEDTELDKSVVDKIGDPLVHMIRNSVDHGLESSPDERRQAGKPEIGRVQLRAFHSQGSLVIEIEDDGRGLNRDLILQKAMEKGLIESGENLSDEEVWKLIFAPGFSTAARVTDISGRGVGMDVVRRNIEALRGKVDIRSESGQGTIFSIRLPLTLAIIDGMVIQVGDQRYVIPTLSIRQSIQLNLKSVRSVLGTWETFTLHGEVIPLFRLSRVLGISNATEDLERGLVVVVDTDDGKAGLFVAKSNADGLDLNASRASRPLGIQVASNPRISRRRSPTLRREGSSSTKRIRPLLVSVGITCGTSRDSWRIRRFMVRVLPFLGRGRHHFRHITHVFHGLSRLGKRNEAGYVHNETHVSIRQYRSP